MELSRLSLLTLFLVTSSKLHAFQPASQFHKNKASHTIHLKKAVNDILVPPASKKVALFQRNGNQVSTNAAHSALYAISRYSLPSTGVEKVILDDEEKETENNWKNKLLRISNIASMLCVVDCTVLPIVTLVLPLLGLGRSIETMKFLDDIGHAAALYFVLPVGGFAAYMNFMSHRKMKISAFALLGLSLIYLANGSGGPILSLLPHGIAHALHCGGIAHRLCNVSGCALLLGSNHISRKQMRGCAFGSLNVALGKDKLKTWVCCNMPFCKNNLKDEEEIFFSWK